MPRGGGGESPSQTINVPAVAGRKGRRAAGRKTTKRRASPSSAKPWTPARSLYGDLKIPITVVKKKS
jgi:hypothetical protein